MPGSEIHLVWKSLEPVIAQGGMSLVPTVTLEGCPQLDLICVPGGPGMNPLLGDEPVLEFLRRQAPGARYVAAVCTGALVLGAAGLLRGRRAATHWTRARCWRLLSPTSVKSTLYRRQSDHRRRGHRRHRLCPEGCGGDAGEDAARTIQLSIEYDPRPPFDAGLPERAGEAIVARQRQAGPKAQAEREAAVARAAQRLGSV